MQLYISLFWISISGMHSGIGVAQSDPLFNVLCDYVYSWIVTLRLSLW